MQVGKECKFYHDKKITQEPGSIRPGGGQPGGRARIPSPGAKADSPFRWNLSKRDKTAEDCRFLHRKVKPVEQQAFEKYKVLLAEHESKRIVLAVQAEDPNPKAKAKAKADGK